MKESFLDILGNYFSKLPQEDILAGDSKNIEIPFEWLFTEKLDRVIIQKALVNIFIQNTPNYKEMASFRNNDPDSIDEIIIKPDRFNNSSKLLIKGADEWSKLIVTDYPNPESKLPQITSEELNVAIMSVLNAERLDKVLSLDLGLTPETSKYVQSAFADILNSEKVVEDTSTAMRDLATNLTKYYDYLVQMKKEPDVYDGGLAMQRQNEKGKRKNRVIGIGSELRKSPIYPFTERDEIFRSLKPEYRVINGTIDEEGNIEKNAYTTYVYINPREYEGHLFVSEPLEGSHETRMTFVPKEAFENYEIEEGENRLIKIAKDYIEMSREEFLNAKHTKLFMHNGIDSFRNRVEHTISGTENEITKKNPGLYKQYDAQIFEGKVVTQKNIKDAVQNVTVIIPIPVGITRDEIGGQQK